MDKLFVLLPFLKFLTDPKPYRTIVAWMLRILAFAMALAFIFASIQLWKIVGSRTTAELVFLCIFFQIILAGYFYLLANILWFRAGSVDTSVSFDDYPVTLIFNDLLRLGGEVLAATFVCVGLAGFIAGLFPIGGQMMAMLLPMFETGGGIIGGLIALGTGIVAAFASLIVAYFLAELTRTLVDIARNTKKG